MCSFCEPFYSWEIIDARDVMFFKAPLLKQNVDKALISNQTFSSLKECFRDAFGRATDDFEDRSIAVCQYHTERRCPIIKRRYTLESTNALTSLSKQDLRCMCCCSHDENMENEGILHTFCQECLDRALCSTYRFESVQNTLVRSIMSAQTEWHTWYYSSVDFFYDLSELWTGNTTHTITSFRKKTNMRVIHKDYTVYCDKLE